MNRLESPDPTAIYTVGWICALEDEYECACSMLDEELNGPEIDDKDDNTYACGRIGGHYIVIGCLPVSRYGTNSAARVARDMVRSFPRLRFALMVGIGGGVPTKDNDIRLGDVVVSQPRAGSSGVIQYDFGRRLQNGRFQKTGQLNAPPEKLLGAIPEIKRRYNDRRKPDQIAEHIQRMDGMEGYQRPKLDQLYTTEYQHVGGKNCGQCDPESIVKRLDRCVSRTIAVHYGTIASGNTVMMDATLRDTYAEDPNLNILCFEMEAAGLMNNLPCLVIRGICNYCDSHKNDEWHKYAALTAAAYARHLLSVLKPDSVQTMPSWAEQIVGELQQVQQDMITMIDSQSMVQSRVDTIDRKIDWANLSAVEGAGFDSYMDQHEDECLPGTRTEVLHEITEWAASQQGKCIFWLNGMAGTGKSTISRTVAKLFTQSHLLGASFFFKRGEGDRGNAKKFFPTIVRQLMTKIPPLIPGVRRAIDDNPDIIAKSLREQFEKLLLQPLQSIQQSDHQVSTIVIVIDALDECERNNDIRVILQLLPQVHRSLSVYLRFFLTSRPELPLRLGFKDIIDDHQDLILHEVPKLMIKRDISLFLEHKLAGIRRDQSLPPEWPGNIKVQTLVMMSVPLFIFAATMCRILEDPQWDPVDSLTEILTHQSDESNLDRTYLPVLNRLIKQNETKEKQLVKEFQDVVGVIILLETPLSVISLARFLGVSERFINTRLNSLHSVLSVPDNKSLPVRLLHLSFRDFLVDPKSRNKTPFWVDEKEIHCKLTGQCLEIMRRSLKRNICELPFDSIQRTEIDAYLINRYLPSELQYSCRYWLQHLSQSKDPPIELKNAFPFLEKHFLHWVEAMSILDIVSEVVGVLDTLQSLIKEDINPEISEFLCDAKQFILKNRQIVEIAPLQIYGSSLIFAPQKSIIRGKFCNELPHWICEFPKVEEFWSAELQTLEGHSSLVWSVAFSPDGRLLASGSDDGTIKLWDTATGGLQQTLEGHSSSVSSVAFTPDGRLLASSSSDRRVKLWDTATGDLEQTLTDHSSSVLSVAFSPDGQLLALGCDNGTIKLWDTATEGLRHNFEGHLSSVWSVTFSPDGRLLASSSNDKRVKLWDTATGGLQQTFNNHSSSVLSVAFSPDGQLLASGSYDKTIKIWDTATGTLQQTLKDHLSSVSSVAFSPDGQLLASGSDDKTVKLWDTATGGLQRTLKGHSEWVQSVTFSPDGRLLASGSSDKTIKLWDNAIGGLQRTLQDHSSSVFSVTFSPDGQLLASGSDDGTIKFWDTATGGLQQTLEGHSSSVSSVAFSPDGRLLASGFDDGRVKLWDTATRVLQQILKGHLSSVWSVTFSPDGRLLASSSNDTTVKLWDTATGGLQQTFESRSSLAMSVAFSPDGRLLASSPNDRRVQLWDTATGGLQQTLRDHLSSVSSVAFLPDGRLLASGSDDGTIKLWDTATGELQQTLEGHSGWVWSVTFSPDGRLLASGSNDKTGKLWDTATGGLQRTLKGHLDWVRSVTFSPDGRLLASGSDDKTIKLWDTATGGLQWSLNGHLDWVQSVMFSPDGRLLASSSNIGRVMLWDTTTGGLQQTFNNQLSSIWSIVFLLDNQILVSGSNNGTVTLSDNTAVGPQQTLEGHSSLVLSIAFSPNGQLLASSSGDKTVKLWDTATRGLQQTLESHSDWVRSVAFSPDGRLLASGSDDKTIKLWDTATGGLQRTLNSHLDWVQSVMFSPDGRLLASSSNDKTVKLWDTATRGLQQTLESHSDWVRSVAFSPDGRLLASSSNDKTIKLWDTAIGALQQTLTIDGAVTNLKFSEDSPYLTTNLGFLNIQPWYNNYTSNLSNFELFIRENQWVTLQGKDVLWLPPEYRPSCSAVKGSLLALGHASGRVSFIGFCTYMLNQENFSCSADEQQSRVQVGGLDQRYTNP